jgi:hypothetical protein
MLPVIGYADYLRPETQRVFATVASIRLFDQTWNVGSAFPFDGSEFYSVRAEIRSTRGRRVDAVGSLPAIVSSKVPAISNLSQLVSHESADRIWQNANSEADLHASVTIGAIALCNENDIGVAGLKQFSICTDFMDSLQKWQCASNGRFSLATRTLCSQLVAGVCHREIGNFGLAAPRLRVFDQAAGCRVHLTEGKLAIRLMFWKTPTEMEFANVGAKRELYIADGLQDRAVIGNSLRVMV